MFEIDEMYSDITANVCSKCYRRPGKFPIATTTVLFSKKFCCWKAINYVIPVFLKLDFKLHPCLILLNWQQMQNFYINFVIFLQNLNIINCCNFIQYLFMYQIHAWILSVRPGSHERFAVTSKQLHFEARLSRNLPKWSSSHMTRHSGSAAVRSRGCVTASTQLHGFVSGSK